MLLMCYVQEATEYCVQTILGLRELRWWIFRDDLTFPFPLCTQIQYSAAENSVEQWLCVSRTKNSFLRWIFWYIDA